MKKLLLILGIFTTLYAHAQTGNVGIGTNAPHPSAKLDIISNQ